MDNNTDETDRNELMRKLAGYLAQIYSKHIDELNPSLTRQKMKLIKIKPSQSMKPYERCDNKILDRPLIQMFKHQEENLSGKVKILKKSSKGTANIKKRNIKTYKVSNLYFDPEGDSVKRYRELYTYKNSPGIRTMTNIQEAVKIYNETLQKERAKKNYLERRRKRREERSFSDSHTDPTVYNKLMEELTPGRLMKARSLQSKEFMDQRKQEERNFSAQRKLQRLTFPSKDFLERNKLRKPKAEKPLGESGSLSKPITLPRLPLLPSQEFLNRNMPRRMQEDGELTNSPFSEFLLRVKTINTSVKKPLPVPVVRIGFQDEVLSNPDNELYSRKLFSLNTLKCNKNNFVDAALPPIKSDGNYDEKTNNPLVVHGMNRPDRNITFSCKENKYLESAKSDFPSICGSDLGNLVDVSPVKEESDWKEENVGSIAVKFVNVGFLNERCNINFQHLIRDRQKFKDRAKGDFTSKMLSESGSHWTDTNEKRHSMPCSSRKQSVLPNRGNCEKSGTSVADKVNEFQQSGRLDVGQCSFDSPGSSLQWRRMQESVERFRSDDHPRHLTIKKKLSNITKITLPDKLNLSINKWSDL